MKKLDVAFIAMPTALVLLALGLAGCSSTPQPINIDRSALMPEAAATKIIAQWVPDYRGGGVIYVAGDPIRLSSVNDLYYLVPSNRLRFTNYADICAISLDQAKQLVQALAALGAPVTLAAVDAPLGDLVPCTR